MIDLIIQHRFKSISILLLLTFLLLNGLGFCFENMRFISDDEKIKIAISHVLKQYEYNKEIVDSRQVPSGENDNSDEAGNYLFPLNPIPYRDEADFLSQNPNCCHVTFKYKSKHYEGSAYEVGFWEFILGKKTSIVVINYIFKYKDATGKEHTKTADWFSGMNNCGELKEEY
jgi:hypothetical protein